jgi:hypothetical protein
LANGSFPFEMRPFAAYRAGVAQHVVPLAQMEHLSAPDVHRITG